eukprot:scaffold930_cov408-Prasinococcus_capsulatus_cf.AAC.8
MLRRALALVVREQQHQHTSKLVVRDVQPSQSRHIETGPYRSCRGGTVQATDMDCVGAAAAKEGPTLPRGMSGRGASAAGSYPVPPKPVGASDFSVMSYNILAQKNINKHRHLYPSVSPHILSWNYRMDTFVSEVRHLMPDVLCLQEVDHFKDIEVRLGRLGYSGSFLQRTGGCDDGCAIFFKSAMFSLQQQVPIRFNALGLRDNVALICVLQRKSPGGDAEFGPERLIVSNTHILFNPRRGEIKLAQVRTLLMAVHRLKEQCEKPCKHSGTQGIGRRTHAIVVGDWNCSPSSPLYRYIRHGTLDLSTTDRRNLAGHMEGSGRRTLQARIDSYVQQGRTSIVGRPGTDEWRTFTATPSKDELSRKYAEEEERFWANQKAVDSRFTDKVSSSTECLSPSQAHELLYHSVRVIRMERNGSHPSKAPPSTEQEASTIGNYIAASSDPPLSKAVAGTGII